MTDPSEPPATESHASEPNAADSSPTDRSTAETSAAESSAPGPSTAESSAPGTGLVVPETSTPDGGAAGDRCPYCDRPFRTDRLRAIHVGEAHPEACTAAERAAHEAATEDEEEDLFVFHLKVVAALSVLYAVLVLVYMVVLGLQG